MDLITKNLKNTNIINTESYLDVEARFVETFNNIFSFDNNDIEVIGTVDKPWFKAKDVLKILGYSDNRATINKTIHSYIPDKYKKERGDVVQLHHLSSPSNYNKDKEIFISEAGLYRLIMRSNKPNAEPFQDFVQDVLIPNIRKQIVANLENENNSLRNDINIIIKQNTLALKRLEEMGITLEETREQNEEILEELQETNDRLDRVLPDRNVDPKDDKLKHSYILLKSKLIDNEYMFLRGQDKYIKSKKNMYNTEYEITLDQTKNPNPVDLVNRLKEKIQNINEQYYLKSVEELKNSNEYLSCSPANKRSLIMSAKRKNSKIIYRVNKIHLQNNYSEDDLLKLINVLDNEKYNV